MARQRKIRGFEGLNVSAWWFNLPDKDGNIPVVINRGEETLLFEKRDLKRFQQELKEFMEDEDV